MCFCTVTISIYVLCANAHRHQIKAVAAVIFRYHDRVRESVQVSTKTNKHKQVLVELKQQWNKLSQFVHVVSNNHQNHLSRHFEVIKYRFLVS